MPSITLRNISRYVCQDVNLEIFDKELLVLLGPSGAGKTTLLNIIAGLTDYKGSVLFDGQPVDELSTSKRGTGYLFQDLVLFPHLDVAANIAYGLRAEKQAQSKVEARVEELLQVMKIKHLSSRYPKHLSGGEKQRVALARALASSPKGLLLDEPLSSLDVQTSKYLRLELRQLQRELGITTIYVTHDLTEAEEMADRIAVIQGGHIEQVATSEEVFFYPENEIVRDFIGTPNILDCASCHSLGQGIMEVSCGGLPVIIPHDGNSIQRVALFPRDIYISDARPPGPGVNLFRGTITSIKFVDGTVRLGIRAGENNLLAELPRHIFGGMELEIGGEVFFILRMGRIKVYEGKEGR